MVKQAKKDTAGPFIMGLDIGYSNIKMVYGRSREEQKVKVMPSSGSIKRDQSDLDAAFNDDNGIVVDVDGVEWVTCVAHNQLDGYDIKLHDNFIYDDLYKALFLSSLVSQVDEDVIDLLVTGLPMTHFQKPEMREHLIDMMKGEHQVLKNRTITVKEVVVLPQPTGAYYSLIESGNESTIEKLAEGFAGVCDVGYFSVDIVGFHGGRMRPDTRAGTTDAISKAHEEVSQRIFADRLGKVDAKALLNAVQTGKDKVLAGSQWIEFKPYLEAVIPTLAKLTADKTHSKFRGQDTPAYIVMAGGGGADYAEAMRKEFPNTEVKCISQEGIAQGYWARGFARAEALLNQAAA